MSKSAKAIYIILCIILIGIFAFAGYKLLQGELGYYFSRKAYNDLSDSFVTVSTSEKKDGIGKDEMVLDDEVAPIEVDFAQLSSVCKDMAAWLYCPDTIINYPVVHAEDNSWYLNHLYDGSWSSSGTLFVDCSNLPNFANDNTIIYGHHMNDGSMFARLLDYANQSYYEAHPVMYLLTPALNYRLELFSGYVTNSSDETTYKFVFSSEDEEQSFIDYARSNSKFQSDVDVKPGDRIITFSTCTYEYDDARFVVHAKMVPIH